MRADRAYQCSMTSRYTPPPLKLHADHPMAHPASTTSSHDHALPSDALQNPLSSYAPTSYRISDTAPSPPSTSPATLQFHPFENTPPPVRPSTKRPPRKLYDASDAEEDLLVRTGFYHPYARLQKQKEDRGKRRKMWNLRLEKLIFTTEEIATTPTPYRRKIYVASLEAHIDRLHKQLLEHSLTAVPLDKLEPYRGLNPKTAKSMICGLHYDASEINLKLLELERANMNMERTLDEISAGPSRPPTYYHIPDAFR